MAVRPRLSLRTACVGPRTLPKPSPFKATRAGRELALDPGFG